ncbi:MAG TPA: type II toxin-antitoxin system VapC family toxin [Chthoniobacterales bacterium]|nr:type II toxin-antitoxin system VapC family toxin [Chthoniobacterales bacterium]
MIVVDTNVIFPLFIRSAESAEVTALREKDNAWRTEPIALVEFSNVLATYQRAKFLTSSEAAQHLQIAESFLGPHLFPVSHQDALELALQYGVTAYDARFLTVAEKFGVKLVTEDARLRAAAPELTQSLAEAIRSG